MSYFRKGDNLICYGKSGRLSSSLFRSVVTCLIGAIVGGSVSACIVISTYSDHQTKPTVPIVQGQQSSKLSKVDYSSTSSYPVVAIAENVGPAVVTVSNFSVCK